MYQIFSDKFAMTVEAPPKDHGGLVRHLFFFIAFVPLLSWNFFTMLTGYWMFKFRDPQPAADQVQTDPDSQLNITSSAIIHSSLDDAKNALQVDFTSYMVGISKWFLPGSSFHILMHIKPRLSHA